MSRMFFTNTRAASTARATRRSGTFTRRKKRKKVLNKRFTDLLESGNSGYGPTFKIEQNEMMLTPSDNSFNFRIGNKGGAPLTWAISDYVVNMFPMLTFSTMSGTLSNFNDFETITITTSTTGTMEGAHSFYLPIDTNTSIGLAPRPSLSTMFFGFTYEDTPDPPAPPDSINYLITNVQETTATLRWTSNSGGVEDGFKIYKNIVDNFNTATLEETVDKEVVSTQITNLTSDTDYFFWIGVIETVTGTIFHDPTPGTFTTITSLPDPSHTFSDTGYYLDHDWLASDSPKFYVRADGKKNQIAPSFWTQVKFDKEIMIVDNFKIDTKNSMITTYVTRTSPADHSKGCILDYLVKLGAKEDTGYLLFMGLAADPANDTFDLKVDTKKNQPPLLNADLLVIESESMSITNITAISPSVIRITVTRTNPQVHNPPIDGIIVFRQSAPMQDLGFILEANLDTSNPTTFRMIIDSSKPLIALKGLTTIWIDSEEMTIIGIKEKPGVWVDLTVQRNNPVPHLANAIVFKDRDPIPHTKP